VALSFKPVRNLLQTGTNATSRWFSYAGLGIGVLLLLCSIQMYINIQQLLGNDTVRKNGYDFVSITKTVTNATMGQPEKNLFQTQDIEELRSKPFISGVAPLIANEFRIQMTAGAIIAFKTDLFLEALDNDFIDTLPPSFHWQEGQMNVPVIISSDFLEAYNVFAPGQGLPQVSQETASSIPVIISCSGNGRQASFSGNVVAFSDRINSVLVPQNFLEWANKNFGEQHIPGYARLYLKTKDANNPDLLRYLDQKNYKVNKDKTKFGRAKQVMQAIFSGLGLFGLLVVIMALMLFSFYLQLVIARSKDNLQLLIQLGYAPGWLSSNVARQFIPVYLLIVFVALALTQLIQWAFHHFVMYDREELSTPVHWVVIITAILLVAVSLVTNFRMVRKLVFKLTP
jgi:hypothetical protein